MPGLFRFAATIALAGLCTALLPTQARAENPPAAPAATPDAAERERAYTQSLQRRVDGVMAALDLKDSAKSDKVRDTVLTQYRALKSWHDEHDAELKQLGKKQDGEAPARAEAIKASLKKLHEQFVARLSESLTAEQVEAVKDQMTYNVVHVTYNAFGQMLPTLTDEQKAMILDTLKTAREEAMDAGSSEEKHAVFGRYKGRINNYLSKQGYDLKQASKDWSERERQRKADAAAAK